jgi:hypothetical protein
LFGSAARRRPPFRATSLRAAAAADLAAQALGPLRLPEMARLEECRLPEKEEGSEPRRPETPLVALAAAATRGAAVAVAADSELLRAEVEAEGSARLLLEQGEALELLPEVSGRFRAAEVSELLREVEAGSEAAQLREEGTASEQLSAVAAAGLGEAGDSERPLRRAAEEASAPSDSPASLERSPVPGAKEKKQPFLF